MVVGRHLRRYWTCHRALPLQCQSHQHTARHLFPSIPEHQQALPRLQSHWCHPNKPVSVLQYCTCLSNNNPAGGIPCQLSALPEYARFLPLPNLRFLSLAANNLNGTFQRFIININCTSLQMRYLNLLHNAFLGPIPDCQTVPRG
jgi:hypothetical protein